MTQMLDISGILITHLGDRIPCKLVNVNDKGYLEIFALDPVEVHSRLQLLTGSPRIETAIKVTSSELTGDVYTVEAIPESSIDEIKKKIITERIKGIINK